MTFPNPPSVYSPIPNQPFHSPETPATFDRLSGVLTPNIQLEPNPTAPYPEPWQRPGSWLALPPIKSTQEKFAGLLPIYNVDENFVAFTFEGDYIVDWGDGYREHVASGEKAQHAYDWNRIPSTTLTSEGFKQVVVTVVPQSGSHLTTMNIAQVHDNLDIEGVGQGLTTAWLDVAVSMPHADSGGSIGITNYYIVTAANLHKVSITNSGSASAFDSLFEMCYNLRDVQFSNVESVESMDSTFVSCHQLQTISLSGLVNVTTVASLFASCYSLVSVNLEDLHSAVDFTQIFNDCQELRKVRMTGLHSVDSYSAGLFMGSYTNLSNTNDLTLEDLTILDNLVNSFADWDVRFRGSLKLTGLESLENANMGLGWAYGLESVELWGTKNLVTASNLFAYCKSLQHVYIEDTGKLEDMSYMFGNCDSLKHAPDLDTSNVTSMYGCFSGCFSLSEVPLYDTSKVDDMGEMFSDCVSLDKVPLFDTSSCTDTYYMFNDCISLTNVPKFNTESVEDATGFFYGCGSLRGTPSLNLSSTTPSNLASIFEECYSLASAPLQGVPQNISFANCCLSRNAIVEIFNGLANASATIDVSYNYGAADLTPSDIAIAEGKGWSVTY